MATPANLPRGVFPFRLLRGVLSFLLCSLLACGALYAAVEKERTSDWATLTRLAKVLRTESGTAAYDQLAVFVRESPDPELRAQAAFALGVFDSERERWAEAHSWLQKAQSSKILDDYAALYRARAGMELGEWEAARDALASKRFSGSTLAEDVQVLQAKILARAGRSGAALQSLKAIPGFEKRAALLFTYGEILAGADREKEAIKVLRRVYFGFPLSTRAEPAKTILVQLEEETGAGFADAGVALWRERAEYLWAERAYIGAWAAYQNLSGQETGQAQQGALLRATAALYNRGSRRAACRKLKAVGVVPEVLRGEKRALQARCEVRAGNWEEAQSHLAYLALHFPGTPEYEAALRATADTAWVRGENTRAILYYQQYRLAFPDSPAAAGAHWRFAWAVYGKGDAAAKLFEDYIIRPASSSFHSRALYWRARLALEEKQEALARHLFTKAVANTPRDYLAQRAQEYLAKFEGISPDGKGLPEWAGKIPARKNVRPIGALPASLQPRVDKAVALNHLGLEEMASRELEAGLQQNPHPAFWFEAARLAARQGNYLRAAENTRRAFPGYLTADLEELPREAWELLFPLPYWDVIHRESQRRGVDPFLVAGLIRQESRFDREAVSSVGALGLMQLMPPTARQLARNRRLSRERILEPERNIRLGVLHLSQLLRRFDGNVEKAVAAYNGGGTRVAQWSKELPADIPAFVESIPLKQTRNFVYIVLRNYQFYRDLYGGGEAPVIQRSRSSE